MFDLAFEVKYDRYSIVYQSKYFVYYTASVNLKLTTNGLKLWANINEQYFRRESSYLISIDTKKSQSFRFIIFLMYSKAHTSRSMVKVRHNLIDFM